MTDSDSDSHLRTPATIHPHPIGLLPIADRVPLSIGREDLHPSVVPGVIDMDHLNGLLELDDPAARSVIDRVARAVGECVGEEKRRQQVALPMNAPAAAPIEVPRIVLFEFLPPTA